MKDLPGTTWIRFVVWLVVGLVIYAAYGYRHSRLRERDLGDRGMTESPIRHGGKVVVGYEGGPTGHDALTFAGQWAARLGGPADRRHRAPRRRAASGWRAWTPSGWPTSGPRWMRCSRRPAG